MLRRTVPALAVCAGLAAAGCGSDDSGSGAASTSSGAATSSTQSTTTTATSASAASGGANTAEVVPAAQAFLKTLSSSQRDAISFDAGDDLVKTNWSNLPAALAPRQGVRLGDLSAAQRAAALKLMRAALSDQGYTELQEVREADDFLAEAQASGTGGGPGAGPGGGDDYGAGNYYLAFFGTPSTSDRWLLQYTGHHLTFNIGYHGSRVTFGPAFEGVEPISFKQAGRTIAPLSDEASGFGDTIAALSAAQRSKAQLDKSYDDLLLGAGNDGPFPDEPEGVTVGDLPQGAQDAVTRTIRAYVGDLDEAAAEAKVKAYVAAYDRTGFAFAGGTDTTKQGFYARIDGPKAWIEISTQRGVVLSGTHYHSIYREQGNDYGSD